MGTSAIETTVDGGKVIRLPRSWSNNARDDYLRPDAYASFTRLIGAAVAATGGTWGLNDAKRPMERQVTLFNQNYERWQPGRAYVRTKRWNGVLYGRRAGTVEVAVPGTSDHGPGFAVDITGSSIQAWLHTNAGRYGWVFDVRGEPWHMAYKLVDQYRSWPVVDWAWVQALVGAAVDGKPGAATITAVKAWQTAHGQTADGLIGPATAKAMIASATLTTTPAAPAAPPTTPTVKEGFLMTLTPEQQIEIYNDTREVRDRVMGRDGQRYYTKDAQGNKNQVAADAPGAIASQTLDDLDGDYLVNKLDQLAAKIDALAARVK